MEKVWSVLGYWRVVAPMAALALGCLSGAAWSRSWEWGLVFLAVALLVSRVHWRWWVSVVLLASAVAWRGEVLEVPVAESLSRPGSEWVDGTLKVGRMAGVKSGERFGTLVEGGEERRVMIMKAGKYRPGEVLRVKGTFFVPERERNPGVFPQLDLWERQGVFGGFVVKESESVEVDWKSAPLRWAEDLREGLGVAITRGLSEGSKGRAVIQAMVLGDKPPRDSEVSRAFRESGAMHVFAVSGLHVTLVGVVFWLFLRPFPIQRRTGLLVVMLVMAGYALVTGLRPPAVRATVMAVCFFGAFFVRRRPSLFNALAFSVVLVLMWRPSQVFEVGFQLSYGVLLSIGLGVGIALKLTGRVAELDPFFPARLLSDGQRRVLVVRTYFANLGASSLAAWVGSVPMMVWHFGVVTPIAVMTSLLLIPATMAILSLAFLAAIVGMVLPVAGSGINQVNEGVAGLSFQVAKGFSKVPLGHWQSRRLTPCDWVIFDCEDGGAASFLDVEGGVMLETGGRRFYERQLKSILGKWQVWPETVFVTHPDGDHVGGLPFLLKKGGVKKAVMPVEVALSPGYREFLGRAGDFGCEVTFGKTGQRYDLGEEVWVEILWAKSEERGGTADSRMMVMKVHWNGWKVLVTGDLGMRGELELLEEGVDLSADVVWMGRHEWGVSGQHQFLKATEAQVVITSGASIPAFERPPSRWLTHVKSEGYELFNQAETGAVMMDFDQGELRVRSYLQSDREVVLQR